MCEQKETNQKDEDGSKCKEATCSSERESQLEPECEKLLRNAKKQVKQMMEEAVTRKFVHEESSSIISLCVAIDACLSHGLKRRALGLFKTNSSTALIQKAAKSCKSAKEILELVADEEKLLCSSSQLQSSRRKLSFSAGQQQATNNSVRCSRTNSMVYKSPVKQVASNLDVHRRNLWIKCALLEGKLVSIVEYLAENANKYYEPEALMSNYLCAQLLCSLLVGPTALEFSRSKTNDCYLFEDPTADELLKRHKLANPIACLCNNNKIATLRSSLAHNLIQGATTTLNSDVGVAHLSDQQPANGKSDNKERSQSPSRQQLARNRRKPLAIKTNVRQGTLITDCHHYSCQEISEHQQVRGYSFLSTSISSSLPSTANKLTPLGSSNSVGLQANHDWSPWSPRMLHETLHQNPKSSLIYAKNNVLLETQPNKMMAGYLSLHQTNSDLILKWIPNQMINGGQLDNSSNCESVNCHENEAKIEERAICSSDSSSEQTIALESSYLDLVVSLSVSQIVLLHCQFGKQTSSSITSEPQSSPSQTSLAPTKDASGNLIEKPQELNGTDTQDIEETLILVETDGVQRAPIKFPKGGLRLFLSCLENGLKPGKYLDPAIRFDEIWPDTLQSPPPISANSTVNSLQPSDSTTLESPSAISEPTGSRLEVLLRRLPSLKRSSLKAIHVADQAQTNGVENSSILNSASLPSRNYVYRIVSMQQPDWPLQTPPHSALSVDSTSSCSNGQPKSAVSRAERFRWSLSRLTRFSSRYTHSGSTSSGTNSSIAGIRGGSSSQTTNDGGSVCDMTDASIDNTTIASRSDIVANDNRMLNESDKSKELSRIEAKLDELKQSTSDEVLSLRTNSIQTLCDSMRKQIVARAFYGWIAYCRRVKIVRDHLVKLIKEQEKCYLLNIETRESQTRWEELKVGLTREKWKNLMGREGEKGDEELRLEVNLMVFYGGIENDELRKEVWPYLLEHYHFGDSPAVRRSKDKAIREAYESCGREWIIIERVVKQRDSELLASNIARASKESKRRPVDSNNNNGDSNLKEAQEQLNSLDEQHGEDKTGNETGDITEHDENCDSAGSKQESRSSKSSRRTKATKPANKKRRRRPRLESTGSVGSDASITDHFGNNIHRIDKDVQRCDRNFWYFKEAKNLDKLRNIMCSYVWQHLDVGYVQGMCDLAAPFLVIFNDEVLAYSCFSQLMKRMVYNFPHGGAMDQHFESLKYLMQVLDPKLFEILQSNGDYTHFYFCYRWLLLDFKREFAYEDVYRVWETIWSACFVATEQFVVFMALAMVRFYRDIIIENNMDFTDTIKFFNEMAERHDAKKITALARDCLAELQSLIREQEKP